MSRARDKAITGKDAREVDGSERGRTKQYLVYPLLSELAIRSGKEKRAEAARRMSGFSLQFNPCPLPPSPRCLVSPRISLDGILNGDTKATLVAWGDDITFLDRDEDNGRRRISRQFEHRA